jgi:hypothetical protein
MAMDLTGASITTTEVREITNNIEQISKDIKTTMGNVDDIMTTLTGQSEGGLIDKTTEAVKDLTVLMDTLVECIFYIGNKIAGYLEIMLTNDKEATETLMKSIESNLYGTR